MERLVGVVLLGVSLWRWYWADPLPGACSPGMLFWVVLIFKCLAGQSDPVGRVPCSLAAFPLHTRWTVRLGQSRWDWQEGWLALRPVKAEVKEHASM